MILIVAENTCRDFENAPVFSYACKLTTIVMQYVFKYLLNKHLSRIPNNKHCPLLNKHAFSLCWLYIVNIDAMGGTQISAVYEDNVCLLMISAEFPLQQDITESEGESAPLVL